MWKQTTRAQTKEIRNLVGVFVFQGFVSFLLPCFAVDHLYLSYDEYLFSEEETPLTEGNYTFNQPTPNFSCTFNL